MQGPLPVLPPASGSSFKPPFYSKQKSDWRHRKITKKTPAQRRLYGGSLWAQSGGAAFPERRWDGDWDHAVLGCFVEEKTILSNSTHVIIIDYWMNLRFGLTTSICKVSWLSRMVRLGRAKWWLAGPCPFDHQKWLRWFRTILGRRDTTGKFPFICPRVIALLQELMDVVRRIMLSWEVLELGLRNFMSMIFVVGVAVVLVLVFVYRVYINKPSQFDILLRGLFSAKTRTSGNYAYKLFKSWRVLCREEGITWGQSLSNHRCIFGPRKGYRKRVCFPQRCESGIGLPQDNHHPRVERYYSAVNLNIHPSVNFRGDWGIKTGWQPSRSYHGGTGLGGFRFYRALLCRIRWHYDAAHRCSCS